jgi:hypothetical protein
MPRTRISRCLSGITVPGRDARRAGSRCAPRFVLDNRLDAIQAAKAWTGGKRSCKWRPTDSNLRAGRALPVLTPPLAPSGSLEKILCQSPRGWGWCSAGGFASVKSPRRAAKHRGGHSGQAVEHGSPSLQRGEASHHQPGSLGFRPSAKRLRPNRQV